MVVRIEHEHVALVPRGHLETFGLMLLYHRAGSTRTHTVVLGVVAARPGSLCGRLQKRRALAQGSGGEPCVRGLSDLVGPPTPSSAMGGGRSVAQ